MTESDRLSGWRMMGDIWGQSLTANTYPREGKNMATIIIDGARFDGNNISIRNGRVTIDGKLQDGTLNGVVEVRVVEGILGRLECDAAVTCGEVRGDVSAGGSVTCENVGGGIQAGGSVKARGRAGGTIQAGGSVSIG